MSVELTIIGFGQVGASIGLALADKSLDINRSGYEFSAVLAAKADKAGIVDKVQRNIHTSVEKADLVILDVPEDEIRPTLELIREDLKPNCLVMDTSSSKSSPFVWAAELLPEGRHFIGFTPILASAYLNEAASGIEAAHADLFKDSLVLITTPPDANPDTVRVALELAGILGCKPYFIDPFEAQGLLAAVHGLPRLVSAALVNSITGQPGWEEARKVAGKAFAQSSAPLADLEDTRKYSVSLIENRENITRALDNLIHELQVVRKWIQDGDGEKLDEALHNAGSQRRDWLKHRKTADWEPQPTDFKYSTAGETFGRLFGIPPKKNPPKKP